MKKFSKLLSLFSIAIITAAATLYFTALVINWQDRSASQVAQRFHHSYHNRPPIRDRDNAYVYLMGFSVGRDQDPRDWGSRRITWTQRLINASEDGDGSDPPGEDVDFRSIRCPAVRGLSDACQTPNEECRLALNDGEDIITEWLATEGWLLARYRNLLAHTGWFETAPLISSFQLSAYADALEGQKLLFVQVWMLAGRRDVMSIRTLLEDDLTFWRKTLAESDLLISKMIAVAAIKRHFAWSNIALRRLPAVIAMQAVPPVWMKPFDEAERSLRRPLTGEWVLSDSGLREAKSGGANPLVEFFESDEESTSKHLLWLALRSMLQPQDLSNRYAELMEIMIESLNVPLEQYPQAIERVRALQHQAAEITLPPRRVYNVMGDILFAMAAPEFTRYATRVADLEGIQRAAVLATELRSQGVSPAQVHQHLQAAENRDPYDGSPFTWDASADAIIFYGLEPGERGRHRFFY